MKHVQFSKNFNSKEFDSPDEEFSGLKMQMELIAKLQYLRNLIKEPLIVSSGYRTKYHNKNVGGTVNSAHLTGHAVDLRVTSSSTRYFLIKYALMLGVNRIGIGKNFIHLDISKKLPNCVVWLY